MQLTPEFEAKRRAYQASAPEDSDTANCLPPGMPGIMTQPYPMEFLMTPGKVTIVIEAYTQVRHIYTDGRKLPARSRSEVLRHFSRPLGRRHARRRDRRVLAEQRLTRRSSAQRQDADRRALPLADPER